MKKILVTGGTVFVSKIVAKYFASNKFKNEYQVYVLNRNNHSQVENVILINSSRENLANKLEEYKFDIVIDITSYTKNDVKFILDSLGNSKDLVEKYILLSSSAVYPETLDLPFMESDKVGKNIFWNDYGLNKIEAENYLQQNFSNYYIYSIILMIVIGYFFLLPYYKVWKKNLRFIIQNRQFDKMKEKENE